MYVEYFETKKNMSKNVKSFLLFFTTQTIFPTHICVYFPIILLCVSCVFISWFLFHSLIFLYCFFSLFVFLLLRLYFAVYFFVCFVISTRMCHRYICVASVMWLSHTYHSNIVNFRYTSNENIYSNHGRTIYSVFS